MDLKIKISPETLTDTGQSQVEDVLKNLPIRTSKKIVSAIITTQLKCQKQKLKDRMRIKFSLQKKDWKTFIEELDLFFEAKSIKKGKQKTHLLVQVTEAPELIK